MLLSMDYYKLQPRGFGSFYKHSEYLESRETKI